jgi:hypothetical protein
MIGKKVADFVSINLGSYKEEATTLQVYFFLSRLITKKKS